MLDTASLQSLAENTVLLGKDGQNSKLPLMLKNGVFWDVTPCGSCKNRPFDLDL
jgi:hypothetical protein